MVYLLIYVTDNCEACKRTVSLAHTVKNKFDNVSLEIKNISHSKSKVTIVPAVFINEDLFCYGELDINKLTKAIQTN